MIPININDQQFEISSDLSVLEAAREHGIRISTFSTMQDWKRSASLGNTWTKRELPAKLSELD